MALLKVGEKDRDGRQKRIEHSGRYLRASRTGGLSLRAQTRAAGINLTGNTNHGVRISTRLAKNTQVAFQNGRFILRGRYGSDAAKFNLSRSGVSVSSKTPIGSFNWVRPGRSSAKLGGVQLRGHKAAQLQGVFMLFYGLFALLGGVLRLLGGILSGVAGLAGALTARRALEQEEADRPNWDRASVEQQARERLAAEGIDLATLAPRDLLAGLTWILVGTGRGHISLDAIQPGLENPDSAAARALTDDLKWASERVTHWMTGAEESAAEDARAAGLLALHARALSAHLDGDERAELVLALDDACLAAGPRTLLQEALLDLLVETLEVELILEGEA